MDQKKTGSFLRELRKEKGLTQEQAAEKFNTSARTISRWETGAYMPDISLLIDIAEFYSVDVREIIDGERKNDNMDKESKEVAQKMADYSNTEKQNTFKTLKLMSTVVTVLSILLIVANSAALFMAKQAGSPQEGAQPMAGMESGLVLVLILFLALIIMNLYINGKASNNWEKLQPVVITLLVIMGIIALVGVVRVVPPLLIPGLHG